MPLPPNETVGNDTAMDFSRIRVLGSDYDSGIGPLETTVPLAFLYLNVSTPPET